MRLVHLADPVFGLCSVCPLTQLNKVYLKTHGESISYGTFPVVWADQGCSSCVMPANSVEILCGISAAYISSLSNV